MSRSRHTEAEMIAALKQMEAGRKAEDVAREVAGGPLKPAVGLSAARYRPRTSLTEQTGNIPDQTSSRAKRDQRERESRDLHFLRTRFLEP